VMGGGGGDLSRILRVYIVYIQWIAVGSSLDAYFFNLRGESVSLACVCVYFGEKLLQLLPIEEDW
jgi:hypothetical protein